MLGSLMRFIPLTLLAFFFALNVRALPLQTSHSRSPISIPLCPEASVSDALPHSVTELCAAHTHEDLAANLHHDPLGKQLQKRQIGGAIRAIVKGISKLVAKGKAKRREKKLKSQFTKDTVEQGRRDHPEFNWVICQSKHHVNFKGTKGTDWEHEEKNLQVDDKTFKYDLYRVREGEFFNEGGKGSVDVRLKKFSTLYIGRANAWLVGL
ncbi:hypothetical protein C0993_003291 [Termitomyces sp. T159_Od127]|nr:hypothetical protein C0993_003291 [Termitomyces sp. T159_Od127]